MIANVLRIERLKKALSSKDKSPRAGRASSSSPAVVSGKTLIKRAKGLFTRAEVDALERHINESCEREDD